MKEGTFIKAIIKRLHSFKYAFKGISFFITSERNAWIHCLAAIIVVILGIFFNISITHWSILLLCVALVISLEAINTAIEKIIDMISPQYNELAGRIKDIAAGAVLISAIISAIIGILIFYSYC